jgi:hypothetical protein
MKKKLNIDQIQSELRGGSAFFPGYKSDQPPTSAPEERSEKPPKVISRKKTAPKVEEAATDEVPLRVPLGVPSGVPLEVPLIPKKPKRPIRQRQPFDIYEDQYQDLKKIADAERGYENGRSMGQMVREAIDAYLKSHNASNKS